MQRWIERSEARWALWAGILGALATAVLGAKMILSHGASTAGLGFVFLPLVAVAAAVPIGLWGAALGHVVAHLRGRAAEPKLLFWLALLAAGSLPGVVAAEIWHGKSLERAVAATRGMGERELERAFEESRFARDKYFLGALAENPASGPALLERIASVEDPALYEPMWSLWDVMGENRKGIAVMRLVARNRNTSGATLARLEAHLQAQELITEILANPNTPPHVLAKHFDDTHYRAEWGLAMNPKTPPAVLERLARSDNRFAAERARERLKRP
jgi:hypothetical protein